MTRPGEAPGHCRNDAAEAGEGADRLRELGQARVDLPSLLSKRFVLRDRGFQGTAIPGAVMPDITHAV
jgi:hypothetical protein